jgi:Ran GTPase-activating protein (RanGAP) involved in mRNA processing and transport
VKINLTRRGLGLQEAHLLREAVIANPFLSVLKLSYNDLGDDGTLVLATAVFHNGQHHQNLSVIDLGFNSIYDSGAEALAIHVLAGNPNIKVLYLSGNQIGEKGALAIAGAIMHGTALSCLHLSANRVGPVGIKAIVGSIAKNDISPAYILGFDDRPRNVTELHVSDTCMTSDGFIAIPGLLLLNSTLRSINVSNNNLDDQDIILLAQALAQNKSVPLEHLCLSYNQITCHGVEHLMNAIWGSSTMKSIKLDNNRMLDRGAQLCAVILTSLKLELLDISLNRISTVGIKALMKNVSEHSTLQYLGMCGIHIDQNGAKAVSFALAYNTSLRVFHLDSCSAGYAAQRHIVAGVISNRRTSLRVFSGFPLSRKFHEI